MSGCRAGAGARTTASGSGVGIGVLLVVEASVDTLDDTVTLVGIEHLADVGGAGSLHVGTPTNILEGWKRNPDDLSATASTAKFRCNLLGEDTSEINGANDNLQVGEAGHGHQGSVVSNQEAATDTLELGEAQL